MLMPFRVARWMTQVPLSGAATAQEEGLEVEYNESAEA
jgi:hypothetical protein